MARFQTVPRPALCLSFPRPAAALASFLPALLLLAGCATQAVSNPPATAVTATRAAPLAIPATDDGLVGAGPIRRYDWFKKLWLERRTKWAGDVAADQHAIVFLGDSITQGWHDNLDGAFPGLKVANRGISGDTSRGALIRLPQDVLALHPSAVVLLIGTNDLEENATPWTIAANIRLIIDALRAHDPKMPVVVCEVFPSSFDKRRPAYLIRHLNLAIREAIADQSQVTLVETWKLFAGPTNDAKPEEFPDLLHPNALGYAKWAAALRPVFATLGFLDQEPDEFTIENDFVSLFNGHDLTGWGYRPTTEADLKGARGWQTGEFDSANWPVVKDAVSFDGLTASPDGRFVAQNGRLIVRIGPRLRAIQELWTTREFPHDFVLRLQFRAIPNTDSGIFVRGPQLQCRDYLIAGPYTKLQHYRPEEWNDIEIVVKGGAAHCTCNGELLEDAMPVPATGPIGLEGDRGQMEYRRIRIQTLP